MTIAGGMVGTAFAASRQAGRAACRMPDRMTSLQVRAGMRSISRA